MATLRYLDASTGYVEKADMDLLGQGVGPAIASYPEGAFVYLPLQRSDGTFDDADWQKHLRQLGFSARFCRLVELAREQDCAIIRLGGDVPSLTHKEW
jgi:hypothetical protein